MINSEEMIVAARMMQHAANDNNRAADRMEESVRQMNMIFDAGYGGIAPRLLESLGKLELSSVDSAGIKPESDIMAALADDGLKESVAMECDDKRETVEICRMAIYNYCAAMLERIKTK